MATRNNNKADNMDKLIPLTVTIPTGPGAVDFYKIALPREDFDFVTGCLGEVTTEAGLIEFLQLFGGEFR
jgi:hypothetical protein